MIPSGCFVPIRDKEHVRPIAMSNPSKEPSGTGEEEITAASLGMFVPGQLPLPVYPKVSSMTSQQQWQALRVLSSNHMNVQPHQYKQPSAIDYTVFQEIQELYKAEQEEYIKWAKMQWITKDYIRALHPVSILEQVYDAEYNMRAHEVGTWPQNFLLEAQIQLTGNRNPIEIKHNAYLSQLKLMDMPKVTYPAVMEKTLSVLSNSCPMPEPCKEHTCKYVMPFDDSVTNLPLYEVHRDLAAYAFTHGTYFVASESALRCLLETDRGWNITMSVVDVSDPEHEIVKVVVLGNEFIIKKECPTQRMYRSYKHVLNNTFAPKLYTVKKNGFYEYDEDAYKYSFISQDQEDQVVTEEPCQDSNKPDDLKVSESQGSTDDMSSDSGRLVIDEAACANNSDDSIKYDLRKEPTVGTSDFDNNASLVEPKISLDPEQTPKRETPVFVEPRPRIRNLKYIPPAEIEPWDVELEKSSHESGSEEPSTSFKKIVLKRAKRKNRKRYSSDATISQLNDTQKSNRTSVEDEVQPKRKKKYVCRSTTKRFVFDMTVGRQWTEMISRLFKEKNAVEEMNDEDDVDISDNSKTDDASSNENIPDQINYNANWDGHNENILGKMNYKANWDEHNENIIGDSDESDESSVDVKLYNTSNKDEAGKNTAGLPEIKGKEEEQDYVEVLKANWNMDIALEDLFEVNNCSCKNTPFEEPPQVMFQKYSVSEESIFTRIMFLVHSSHKYKKDGAEVLLEPIVELQPELGGIRQSAGKIRALALSLMLRPAASLINVRVNHENGNVIVIDEMTKDAFYEKHGDKESEIADTLYTVFHRLRSLDVGQYVLSHDASDGSNAKVYTDKGVTSATDKKDLFDIRPENITMSDAEEVLMTKTPPDLAPVLLPYHKFYGILPLAFSPNKKHMTPSQKTPTSLEEDELPGENTQRKILKPKRKDQMDCSQDETHCSQTQE